MLILNSLFPVMVIILLGYALKRYGLTNTTFLQTSDKLVYTLFFPLMLFWKIGSSSFENGIDLSLVVAVLLALGCMFILSLVLIALLRIPDFKAGSFAQSCYRFNTYIGVAVILTSLGEEGIGYFGIVIALAIPLINVAAVTTLIWFSQEKMTGVHRLRLMIRALLSNPLIIGCVAGIIYARGFSDFPGFLDNTLGLLSMVTLPLALLSIGGSLSFAGLRQHAFLSLAAAVAKLAVFPLIGFFFLDMLGVVGTPFKVGMIFFSLPTSTAIYVLSSQMHSDTELASTAILISTLLSFPVLTFVLLL